MNSQDIIDIYMQATHYPIGQRKDVIYGITFYKHYHPDIGRWEFWKININTGMSEPSCLADLEKLRLKKAYLKVLDDYYGN